MPCLEFSSNFWDRFSQEMECLGPFEDNPSLAVAVSGGSDSLALSFLLKKWVDQQGGTLHAFHIDHQLRSESTMEAQQVKNWLEQQYIPCSILTWCVEKKPTTGLQEKARKARYELLEAACYQHKIFHLVTAHHADDQQETYLIRRKAHSTDYGLAGMSATSYLSKCRLIRPLLSFSKNEIRSALGRHAYLEDPSNRNPIFQRARLREQPLQKTDLTLYQEKRRSEEKAAAHFLAMNAEINSRGYGKLSLDAIQTEDQNTAKRALSFIVRCIGNLDYLPSPAGIEALYQKWDKQDLSPTSIGKCLIYVRHKQVWVTPDRRLFPRISSLAPQTKFWDRFLLQGSLPRSTHIAPLGPHGWSQIRQYIKADIPYQVALPFPAYWEDKKVIAVPFLKFNSAPHLYPPFLYKPRNSLLAELFV